MRVLILSSLHVITNYTAYDLNYYSFAIQSNEKSTEINHRQYFKTTATIVKANEDSLRYISGIIA